jgi:hypothetical protein
MASNGLPELIDQALRQSQAASGRRVEWYAADPRVAGKLQELMTKIGIANIRVYYEGAETK